MKSKENSNKQKADDIKSTIQPSVIQKNNLTNDCTDAIKSKNLFGFLNDAIAEMLQMYDMESIYKYIVTALQKQLPDTIVLCISIDEQNADTKLEAVAGIENRLVNKIISLSGFNPEGQHYKLHPAYKDYFKLGELIEFKGGLVEFSANEFPKLAAQASAKLVGLYKIYTIGINKDNCLFAAVHFFTFNKKEITDAAFITAFIKQAGLILQRIQSKLDLKQSEEMFRMLTETSSSGIFIHSGNNFEYINNTIIVGTGFSKEELMQMNFVNFVYPDDRQTVETYWKNRNAGIEVPAIYECRIIKKGGGFIWAEISASLMDFNGKKALIGTAYNITARKIIEAQLSESELLFRTLAESTYVGIFIFSTDKIQYVNNTCTKVTGYSEEEFLEMPFINLVYASDHALVLASMQKRAEGFTGTTVFECRLNKKEGGFVWAEITSILIDYKGTKALLGTAYDITQRKNAEDELKISEEKARTNSELLKSIMESPHGVTIFSLDLSYCYTAFTDLHKRIMKAIWGMDIYVGLNMLDIIKLPEDNAKAKTNFDKVFKGESFILIEEYGDTNLTRSWWENRYSPICDANNNIVGVTVFVLDISDRIRAQNDLTDSETKFRSLFENAADATFIAELETGIIIDTNQAAARLMMIPREEIIGMHQTQLHPKQISGTVLSNFDNYKKFRPVIPTIPTENKILRPDGTTVDVEISAAIIIINGKECLMGTFRNITQRKEAEIELKKKMHLLESLNDMMVDREIMMIAMKKEINELLDRLGEPKKH